MDPNEKLRQEISMLSSLIASSGSSSGQSPEVSSAVLSYPSSLSFASTRNRIFPSRIIYSHSHPFYTRPYQRSPSLVTHSQHNGMFRVPNNNITTAAAGTVPSTYKYTNPLQTRTRPVFSSNYRNALNQTSVVQDSSMSVQATKAQNQSVIQNSIPALSHLTTNPFKANRTMAIKLNTDSNVATSLLSLSSNQMPQPALDLGPGSGTVSVTSKAQVPRSVHINPAHLVTSADGNSLPLKTEQTTSSSFKIRPHINPGHAAFQNFCGAQVQVPVTSAVSTSASQSEFQYLTKASGSTFVSSGSGYGHNHYGTHLGPKSLPNRNKYATSEQAFIKNKYKVDRRIKRPPYKTDTPTPQLVLNSQRIKLVKKYSTRLVSQSNVSTSLSKNRHNQHLQKIRTIKRRRAWSNIVKPRRPTGRKLSKPVHSPRRIVHIGGNKYLRKNSGRTLKKIKGAGQNVLQIGGSRFISKNKGKTLKRLSMQNSVSASRSKRASLSVSVSQPSTPGKRFAQRAVCKSKLTLSQRTWKKKRYCVYYNRLGECKKHKEGNCPYVHDRKQLSICPKFVAGKCTIMDCKLSHDLSNGRMPPCQFFNKSNCSRENCPFPHIKSTMKRKSPKASDKETKNEQGKRPESGNQRKRKLSIKKSKKSIEEGDQKRKSDDENKVSARYYERSPESQPVVSIIPRRLRNDASPVEENINVPIHDGLPQTSVKTANAEDEGATATSNVDSSSDSDAHTLRRLRLMSKVSRLQERVKPKESTAPQFLSFKSEVKSNPTDK